MCATSISNVPTSRLQFSLQILWFPAFRRKRRCQGRRESSEKNVEHSVMQPLGRNVPRRLHLDVRDHTHMQSDENAMLKLGLHVSTLVHPGNSKKRTKNDGYIRLCVHLQLRGVATTSSATQEVHASSMIFWPTWLTKRHPLSCSWIALDTPPWAQPCPHNQGHPWVLKAVFRWNIFPQSLRGTFKHFDVHPYLARRLPKWLILFRWVETTKWTKLREQQFTSEIRVRFCFWEESQVWQTKLQRGWTILKMYGYMSLMRILGLLPPMVFHPPQALRPSAVGASIPSLLK